MACYITPLDTRHFNVTFCLSEQESPIYQQVVRDVLEKVVQVVYNYFQGIYAAAQPGGDKRRSSTLSSRSPYNTCPYCGNDL